MNLFLSLVLLLQVSDGSPTDDLLLRSLISTRNQTLLVLHNSLRNNSGRVTLLRSRIKKLEAWEWKEIYQSIPYICTFSMQRGDLGFVNPNNEFVIQEALGGNDYLVVMKYQGISPSARTPAVALALSRLQTDHSNPIRVKIMGSYGAGSKVSISGLYYVDRNGPILCLHNIDPSYLEALLRRYLSSSAFRNNQYKVWTDSRGRAVVAGFRGVVGDKVQLEDQQGVTVVVPLKKLSNEDQKTAKRLSREK